MRASLLVGCAACGFQPVQAVTDRGAAGFDGELVGGSIASRGAIEPETYYVGGVRARGYRNEGVTRTTTGVDLDRLFTQPTGEIVGQNFTNWGGDGYPHGLGFGSADHFSVVVDGELYVPAGTTSYVLVADDAGFIEVTVDGAITSVHSDYTSSGTMTLAVANAGWYPILGAMSESYGTAALALYETTSGSAMAIPAGHLRARTTDMRGLVTYLYALEELEYLAGVWLDHGPIDHEHFTPGPSDWGLTNTFSARYAGQILIDQAATHTLGVATGADIDDASRLWIDGTLIETNHWPTLADRNVPIGLLAGWHTIAFDYGNNIGATSLHLEFDGAAVPVDHLRPVVAWGFPMPVYGGNAVASPGVYDLGVAAQDGQVIDTVDVAYTIVGAQTGLTATLAQDGATDPIVVRAQPNEANTAGRFYNYDALREAFVGLPLAPAWQFTTLSNGTTGTISAVVAASTHGGQNLPFAPVLTYTSPPRETPGATALGRVHVEASLDGAHLAIFVRTARDAAQLTAQPWTPVENDHVPAAAADAVVQYQLVITGDGWEFPSIESVEVDYSK